MIPIKGEIWAYGDTEYEIGDIKYNGKINIRKYKEKHITWMSYDIKHFSSALWKKISDAPNNIIPEKYIPQEGDWLYILDSGGSLKSINKGYIKQIKSIKGKWNIDTNVDAYFEDGDGFRIQCNSGSSKSHGYHEMYRKALDNEIPLKFRTNKLKDFPSEGCCESIDINFERYFRNKYGAASYSTSGIRKGISWNSGGWWFVSSVKSCTRKEYEIEELEHFFKKENKEELINKLTTTKKEENYECISKNKSIKICRPDFKVSEGLRKRGIGIKSTGVKILIGNRHCNN